MNFTANTIEELTQCVRSLDIVVPPRGKERTTEHCEQWQIYKLLNCLLEHGYLHSPCSLSKRESPDFKLTVGSMVYGLEATEVINPDYARAQTLPEAKNPNSVIDPSLFKWSQVRKNLKELREIVSRDKLTGSGWSGDSVEKEFASSVLDCVLSKHRKLLKGFDRFSNDCLLIYHNHSTPALDFSLAMEFTKELLQSYWESGFHLIIVQKYEDFFLFTKEHAIQLSQKVD